MVTIDYSPTPKQAMFHASTADEVLFGGAAGGGKSVAIVMDALLRCLRYPRTIAYIFRRTYSELEDTIIKEARQRYPTEIARFNVARREVTLVNGSKICFRHCASQADRFKYSGAEIHWLYLDELTSFEEDIYTFLKTRCRAVAELGITPVMRSSSNPGNIGHSWVKKMFVSAAPYGQIFERRIQSEQRNKEQIRKLQYIPSLATENPHITDDYIFELESKPEALKRALLYGDWDAFEGQVFAEFVDDPSHYEDRRHTHVIAPFDIPVTWPRYMSFDYGYTRPFSVGWWAMGPDNVIYRYREWYGCEENRVNVGLTLSPRQIARGILEREERERMDNIQIDRIADPNIFERSHGDSIAQTMEPRRGEPGVIFRPGDNSRLAGKMQLHERLRFDAAGKPLLQVFNTCKAFIRTVPALPYSPVKPEDVDTDAEDHCVVGDTEVLTENGWVRIADFTDGTGYVIGHDGKPHAWQDCRKTLENAEVFTLTTDDGRAVTATANHRFMLADGTWKRMDELSEGDELREVAEDGSYDNQRHHSGV